MDEECCRWFTSGDNWVTDFNVNILEHIYWYLYTEKMKAWEYFSITGWVWESMKMCSLHKSNLSWSSLPFTLHVFRIMKWTMIFQRIGISTLKWKIVFSTVRQCIIKAFCYIHNCHVYNLGDGCGWAASTWQADTCWLIIIKSLSRPTSPYIQHVASLSPPHICSCGLHWNQVWGWGRIVIGLESRQCKYPPEEDRISRPRFSSRSRSGG